MNRIKPAWPDGIVIEIPVALDGFGFDKCTHIINEIRNTGDVDGFLIRCISIALSKKTCKAIGIPSDNLPIETYNRTYPCTDEYGAQSNETRNRTITVQVA